MAYPGQIATNSIVGHGETGWRHVDYCQNGVWWVCRRTPGNNAQITFDYSTDQGQTWTSVGAQIGAGDLISGFSMFIDADDNMHVAVDYFVNAVGEYYAYYRGTPNAGRTSYNFTSLYSAFLGDYGGGTNTDTVAFRDPTSGWHVFSAVSAMWDTSPTWFTWLVHHQLNSSGTLILTNSWNVGLIAGNAVPASLDFRHTTDPKIVQAGTPSVYVMPMAQDMASAMYFNKLTYSAGSWSQGTLRQISTVAHKAMGQLVYDGTRILMSHIEVANEDRPRLDERNEADTTTTNRNPTSPADGVGYANPEMVVDPSGNIILFWAGQTSQDLKKNTFTRSTGLWSGWTTHRVGTIPQLGVAGTRQQPSNVLLPIVFYDSNTSKSEFDNVGAVQKTVSDSAVATDTSTKTGRDSATTSDAVVVFAPVSVQDGAITADNAQRTPPQGGEYNEALPYNGTGTYNFPDLFPIDVTDNLDSFDYVASLNASIPRSDSGIAADTSALAIQKPVTESGVATDAATLIKETRFVSDAAGVSEFAAIGTGRFVSESGLGTDTSSMQPGLLVVSDAALADDTISGRAFGVFDDAVALDGSVRSVDRFDSGVATDTAQQSILKPVTDSGLATDSRTGAILIGATGFDVGLATDLVTGRAYTGFTAFDSAVGVDTSKDVGPVIVVPVMERLGEFGFAAQSGMGSAAAQARWAMPLGMPEGSGLPEPVVNWSMKYPARGSVALQEVRRELVPWLSDFTVPAFTQPLPTLLRGLLPSESIAGTQHTQVPSATDVWFTFYSRRPGLAYERYIDGLIEGLRFDFTSGMPVQIGVQAQGRTPEYLASPFTSANVLDIRSGWLTYIGADIRMDWNVGTASTFRWECESGSLFISRPATVHGNYRGMSGVYVTRGNLSVELQVELVFRDMDHYRYSVYGQLTGSPLGTTVYGAAVLKFFEPNSAGGRFMQFTLPAVQWDVAPPQPLDHPEQGSVIVGATGNAIVPASIGRSGHAITALTDNGLTAAA